MELSPSFYHRLVRPKWSTRKYIHSNIKQHFPLENKVVLDFGAGTGANCTLFNPSHYYGIEPDLTRVNFAKRMYPEYSFDVFENDQIRLADRFVDIVLIVAVLHHIPPQKVSIYIKEFQRILKNDGRIIVIEPYLTDHNPISNWYMNKYDNGNYIQKEDSYLDYFHQLGFKSEVLKRYRKCFFYNELFFSAYK
ncbi:class I SAM-dependent methyltransferase [Robertmurraya korlensis]|uniref:class I SAM-dependent methyltransferase n=1 Tax=Robertmurraya korlensis TaxID=519977 RepID=UPI000826EE6E|nr:class I SAM-dependent methyltransferase [Robertmurraya korlensis]